HGEGLCRQPGTPTWAASSSGPRTARLRVRAAAGRLPRPLGDGRARSDAGGPGTAVASTPVDLTAIDDHLDVLIAAVVLHQLWIELIGKRLGYDAVDHLHADVTLRAPISKRRNQD